MLLHKRNGGEFVTDAWRTTLREIQETIDCDFQNAPELFTPVNDSVFRRPLTYVFQPNPELSPTDYRDAKNKILYSIKEILESKYIFKQFETLIRPGQEDLFEDFDFPVKEEYFIEKKLTELKDLFEENYFCFTCFVTPRTMENLIAHVGMKHKDDIEEQVLQTRREMAIDRRVDEIKNKFLAAHNLNHSTCTQPCTQL